MKTRVFTGAAVLTVAMAVTCSLGGCNLIPKEEEEYRVQIVKENVADSYALATVEKGDVSLIENISCTYSQLNEEKLSFEISGRKVASVYVNEGDEVHAGDILVSLDVTSIEERLTSLREEIAENSLLISQEEEKIAFYEGRIALASTGLKAREEYILAKQECEERITAYRNTIAYDEGKIAENTEIIDKSVLYSPIDGTVLSLRDGLDTWTAVKDSTAVTIMDTSACAFTGKDPDAIEYLTVGEPVTVAMSNGVEYAAKLTDIDEEDGRLVFELDEPDFSFTVGTRATVKVLIDERKQVPMLPRLTVYGTDDMHYVYRLSDNGVREMVVVEVGLIGNTNVEIISGLEINDAVILRNNK